MYVRGVPFISLRYDVCNRYIYSFLNPLVGVAILYIVYYIYVPMGICSCLTCSCALIHITPER